MVSYSFKVILWTGDALSLCTSVLPPDQTFDVIDTSNVGDHIGLLNVLVCCAPRLKKYVYISSIIHLSPLTLFCIIIIFYFTTTFKGQTFHCLLDGKKRIFYCSL